MDGTLQHTCLQDCRVSFLSNQNYLDAYPPNRMEDALTDLPPVSNFCASDCNNYA
jgi:hypothetical protein